MTVPSAGWLWRYGMHIGWFLLIISKMENIKWRVSCKLTAVFKCWNQEKAPAFCEKAKKKCCSIKYSAPVHASVIDMVKIIASSDTLFTRFSSLGYFLSPNLKKWRDVKDLPTMKKYSLQLTDILRSSIIRTINRDWKNCIQLKGDYVEQ